MHGRPRGPQPGTNAEADARVRELNNKAIKVATAVDAVLKARSAGNHGRPVLAAAAAVLEANPDVYTLWNVRREAFERGPGGREAGTEEIALVARCLAKQPKCYPAWHHRQWLVEKNAVDVDGELTAAEEFLHPVRGDARNFHAWKYRLWLVHRVGRPAEEELAFTQRLLEADRRNFSAWHYRSVLLPRVHAARGHRTLEELLAGPAAGPDQATNEAPPCAIPLYELQAELDLLHTTLQVAPEDPSCWTYYRWLLSVAAEHLTSGGTSVPDAGAAHELLVAEETRCREIAQTEEARLKASQAPGGAPISSASLAAAVAWPLQITAEISALLRSASHGKVPIMDALTALCAIPLIFFARNNPWRPADAVTPACIILFSLLCHSDLDGASDVCAPTDDDPANVSRLTLEHETYVRLQSLDPRRRGYYADQAETCMR